MSRLVAVVVALGSLGLGCGGEDPAPPETPPDDEPTMPLSDTELNAAAEQPDAAEWDLQFALTGRSSPMTARAELRVVEGERPVHLAITGRTSGTDFLMIDLTFDGLDGAMGPHHVEFSLPQGGDHMANSSLDDTWYYSQGGVMDVSVSADGSISGTFDIDLARGTLGDPGEPVVFAPSEVGTELEGNFSGAWVLNCHSHLMGHMSLILGGDYCDALEFNE